MRKRWLKIPAAWVTPLGVIGAVIAVVWVGIAFTARLWVPFDVSRSGNPDWRDRRLLRQVG